MSSVQASSYRIVHRLSPRHVDDLMVLYAQAWWTDKRTRADVDAMLANTQLLFGLIDEATDALVGFSRVLTDYVYRGTLYDVIVREDLQGTGLSRLLLDAVVAHPALREVEAIDLTCLPEKSGLYAKWGWTADEHGRVSMRRPRSR